MALPEVGRMPASISKTLLVCSLLATLYMLISHPCIGFGNPNHAAALACALLPLCWGWRRAAWGEDDTRRVLPREAIDPEFLNPLFNSRVAELWRLDAP